MKRLSVLLTVLLASASTPASWGEDCTSRTDEVYVQIQSLFEADLSATNQLVLRDLLQSLCTPRESSVQPHARGTRYSTRPRRTAEVDHRVDPVWVGIDWYRGRAGRRDREAEMPDYAVPPYREDSLPPE